MSVADKNPYQAQTDRAAGLDFTTVDVVARMLVGPNSLVLKGESLKQARIALGMWNGKRVRVSIRLEPVLPEGVR